MSLEIIRESELGNFLASLLPTTPVAVIIFLIQSTLFLLLVLAADRFMKNRVANVRKFVWFWALMLVPLITILANLTPATRADRFLATTLERPYFEALVFENESNRQVSNIQVLGLESAQQGSDIVQSPALHAATENELTEKFSYWNGFLYAYLCVAFILLGRVPLGWIRLSGLRRGSRPIDDERVSRIASEIVASIGYRRTVEIRSTRALGSPISFGIGKPIILFPERYHAWLSEPELRTSLLHEFSHLRNNDPLRMLLARIIESLFFFQPLVWHASNKITYLSELVADDAVLEGGVEAASYASTLVNLIELGTKPDSHYRLSSGIFSSRTTMVTRMEHLLDDSRGHVTRLGGSNLVLSASVLFLALIATLQFSPRSSALAVATASESQEDLLKLASDALLLSASAEQHDYSVSVDRTQVLSGEIVNLSVSSVAEDNFYQQVTGLMRLLEQHEPSLSHIETSVRRIDGRRWSEAELALLAQEEGILTIPSFAIGEYQTQPISIEVINASGVQLAQNTLAEEAEFEAVASVDKTSVALGESVTYKIRVDLQRRLENIDFSAMKDVEFLEIRFDTGQTRTPNGGVDLWTDFIATIVPLKEGLLTLPSIAVAGQQTQPIDIEVRAPANLQASQGDEDLYLRLEVNKQSVSVNEEFELSIKLYYTINGIRNPEFSELLLPSSVLQTIDQPNQYEERIDGVLYGVYEKRYELKPQASGPLEIPSIRFVGQVNDGATSVREISAYVEGLTINVKSEQVNGN